MADQKTAMELQALEAKQEELNRAARIVTNSMTWPPLTTGASTLQADTTLSWHAFPASVIEDVNTLLQEEGIPVEELTDIVEMYIKVKRRVEGK